MPGVNPVDLVHQLVQHEHVTTIVNTHEAKTHLSKLLARVEQGEEIVIARAGKPVAKLVPAEAPKREVRLGTMDGEIILHPGWDDPMTDEELDEFENAPILQPPGSRLTAQ